MKTEEEQKAELIKEAEELEEENRKLKQEIEDFSGHWLFGGIVNGLCNTSL